MNKENETDRRNLTFTYTETIKFENEEEKQKYLERDQRLQELAQIWILHALTNESIKH